MIRLKLKLCLPAVLMLASFVFSRPLVVVSIFPIYDFVSLIAQDKVETRLLVGVGSDPHSFQPRPSDIANISAANLFFYISRDFEPWAQRFSRRAQNSVAFAERGTLNPCRGIHRRGAVCGTGHLLDPHIWLNHDDALRMIDVVRDNLIAILPQDSAFFTENARNLSLALIDLSEKYKEQFANATQRKIFFAGHNSFSAFAERYNLEFIPLVPGFSSTAAPSARRLASTITQVRESGVRYIFFDGLKCNSLAQTIARETGVGILPLFSIHSISAEDLENGVSFVELMQRNYENILRAL